MQQGDFESRESDDRDETETVAGESDVRATLEEDGRLSGQGSLQRAETLWLAWPSTGGLRYMQRSRDKRCE